MYFTREEYIESVNNIFDAKPWNVLIEDVMLSLVYEDEYEEVIEDSPPPTLLGYEHIAGEFVGRENIMQDQIIDKLKNKPRFTADMMDDPEAYIGQKIHTTLYTSQIAVLMAKQGAVRLVNHKDVLEIANDVDRYIRIVNAKVLTEPHFQPPPAEDMTILHNLLDVLEPTAAILRSANEGSGGYEKLLRKLSGRKTATDVEIMNTAVDLNGFNSSSELTYEDRGSIYDF